MKFKSTLMRLAREQLSCALVPRHPFPSNDYA